MSNLIERQAPESLIPDLCDPQVVADLIAYQDEVLSEFRAEPDDVPTTEVTAVEFFD